ncbi:hypothetical protein [Bacillus cereus]|uniref:Uncharacterized protein n=1 Tax=Bacillus cereus TaxID=1396 RepID=A0A9X7M1C1_BACCE|nr:hypothetical protein [Bacillus cereus]MDA2637889.1 hypothetical protein [Bacillus cereus]QDZ76621.1 hypothetical protein D0437_27660 [Bacillus cereus]
MKPIKHMRSKRGFYIGRLSKEVGNQMKHPTLSSERAGSMGRGRMWDLPQLITLAGELQKKKEKGILVIDPKAHFHEHFHK